MQLVLEVGAAGVECVRLPGWTVVGVAAMLSAPRLVEKYFDGAMG